MILSIDQLTRELISQEGFVAHTELEALFFRGVMVPEQDHSGLLYVPVRAGSTALEVSRNEDLG